MTKICDHTSVGMLVWQDDKLLLIERKRTPIGFAPPAGHVDGDLDFLIAAKRELKEEVGLDAQTIELAIEGRKDNPCRRVGGTWHKWKVYTVQAVGSVVASSDEAKQYRWVSTFELQDLALRTGEYLKGAIGDAEWEANPGIEPVWLEWFKQLNIT